MWHELMEKERTAARNAAHALRAGLDRLMPSRRGDAGAVAAPPPDAAEAAPPVTQAAPPETKPPAV